MLPRKTRRCIDWEATTEFDPSRSDEHPAGHPPDPDESSLLSTASFGLTCTRHIWSLGDPAALEAVFEDLPRTRLGYWHDTAVAARRQELLGEEQGQALDKFSKLLCGISLGDSANGGVYLSPGTGGVDYPLLGSYVLRSGQPLPAAVELDPGVDPGEIPGAHAFLDKFGL